MRQKSRQRVKIKFTCIWSLLILARIMRVIDRYVLVEWIKVFLGTVALILGILLMHTMYNNLGPLIEYGATLGEIFYYYCLVTPSFVPVILPISLLISVIFTLGNFHKNNEITAMRAAGINAFRMTRSLWAMGVLLSLFLLWMNASLVPDFVEKSTSLFEELKMDSQSKTADGQAKEVKIKQLNFSNKKNRRIWYISQYNPLEKTAKNVEVQMITPQGYLVGKILANSAIYESGRWIFTDGQYTVLDENTGETLRSLKFDDEKRLLEPDVKDKLNIAEFTEDPKVMILRSLKKPDTLSLHELRTLIDACGGEEEPSMLRYVILLYSTWAKSFAPIVVIALAIPFSIAGVRTNPMIGVAKTAGLFFSYYILDNIFTVLGGNGTINLHLAVWLPNLIILGFALFMYRKVI